MDWIQLYDTHQLADIQNDTDVSLIFKHSSRCIISKMVLKRLEEDWEPVNAKLYFLDLLNYRGLSDEIAVRFHVHHESPQLLLIHKGECILDASHSDITADEVRQTLNAL